MSENNEMENGGKQNKSSMFGKASKFIKQSGAKMVAKVATGLHISNPIAIVILSLLGGGGALGIFGVANIKNDVPIINEPAWVCDQDELAPLGNATTEGEDAEAIRKHNFAIMRATLLELGYSDTFIVALASCMEVESTTNADRLESDYVLTSQKAAFDAIAGPGTGADAATTMHAYAEYCRAYATGGGWNGNTFYVVNVDGEGSIVACGIGLIQWTAGRAINLINGVDVVDGDYSVTDFEYQLAFLLAEIETTYQSLKPDGDWKNYDGDVKAMTDYVFGTLVFGSYPPASDHAQKRKDKNDMFLQYVQEALLNEEHNTEITSMAELLADGTLEAGTKQNAGANICTNDSKMKTVSMSEAALSLAWLEGGHFRDTEAAYNNIKRAITAQNIINDWDYVEGFNNGDPSGTFANHTVNGVTHVNNCSTAAGKHHDLVACTDYYYFAHLMVLPNELGVNGKAGYFSSCDRGVCVPVRMSGSDDRYPAGNPPFQLAYMLDAEIPMRTIGAGAKSNRVADTMEYWNPTGFFRGYDLYSYSGSTSISPDTILCTWNNNAANGMVTNGENATGEDTEELYSGTLSIEQWNNLRFAPAATTTHNHIVLYVGESNVQTYYGKDFLLAQFNMFGISGDPAENLIKGDYTIKELPADMKAGLDYKSNFSSKSSDPKYTFYTALYEESRGENNVLDDPITGRIGDFNKKTGLRNFAAYSQIRWAIQNGKDTSANPITQSGTYRTGTSWLDPMVANREWRYELAADFEYHGLQFERYAMASMMCSYPTEEDASIYQPANGGFSKDAPILGNVYRDMSYHDGWSGLTRTNTIDWHYDPGGSTRFKLLYFKTPTQNDMLQDLLQLETFEGLGSNHNGTYKKYSVNGGMATNVNSTYGKYGITGYDYKVLYDIIKGDLNNAYTIKMGGDEDEFNKHMNNWMTHGYYNGFYSTNRSFEGGSNNDSTTREYTYGGEVFGINPLINMSNSQRKSFIDKYFYCDISGNPAMKVYAVVDTNKDGKVSYLNAVSAAKTYNLEWNDFTVGECRKDSLNNIVNSNAGRDVWGTSTNLLDGNHTFEIQPPLWEDERIYNNLKAAKGIISVRIYSGKGKLIYDDGEWLKNPNYCDCDKQYCDGKCTNKGAPVNDCEHYVGHGTHSISCSAAGCNDEDCTGGHTRTCTCTAPCPDAGCEDNANEDRRAYMYDVCMTSGDTDFYIATRVMDPGLIDASEAGKWNWPKIEKELKLLIEPIESHGDKVAMINYTNVGAVYDYLITSGTDAANNNTASSLIIAYFDASGRILCNHENNTNANGGTSNWTVATRSCHRHCLAPTQSLDYRWTHEYQTGSKMYNTVASSNYSDNKIVPTMYDNAVTGTDYGDSVSLIYKLAGGDHVAHVSFNKDDSYDSEGNLITDEEELGHIYIDHCTGEWTKEEKDSSEHYNKPLSTTHDAVTEREVSGDLYSKYKFTSGNWQYDDGLWITHASLGDRGIMCDYIKPVSFFGEPGTGKNMQYMLFSNTMPGSCDLKESWETCVTYDESSGNVTAQDCKNHSHWKMLIEEYNKQEAATR